MDFNFENEMIFENTRVLIRPIQRTDVEKLLHIATSERDLIKYSPSQIHTESLLEQYINNAINDRDNKIRYSFIIFDKLFKTFAGSTSFLNISNYDKRIEIGATWIGVQFQKTGLNRNCKYLMLSYVFEELEFERVEFKTDERNSASRQAIEKIGAKLEGILRSHTLMSDGLRRNTLYYGIIKAEWMEIKNNFKL